MGGMFTVLKIREGLKSYDQDPGWYEHPAGTAATLSSGRLAAVSTAAVPVWRPIGGTFNAVKTTEVHGGSHGGDHAPAGKA